AATPSACSMRSSRIARCGCSASRRAAADRAPGATRRASPPGAAPAACTAPAPSSCRTRTATWRRPTRARRGGRRPAAGPAALAALRDAGRVTYAQASDDEALAAFRLLASTEGILPALESAHAIAYVAREAAGGSLGKLVIVNLSGRGDKDVWQVARLLGHE